MSAYIESVERVSIDLSNYCSKACPFCYNRSSPNGKTYWKPEEVISFVHDCSMHGTKAVSLGGGEPLEYDGLFDIIGGIQSFVYVSITSNGDKLFDDTVFAHLCRTKPDLIHLTIHHPDDCEETKRILYLLRLLRRAHIRHGVNLLISSQKIDACKKVTVKLFDTGLTERQIIFVPQKYTDRPTPAQVAEVAGKRFFQSTSCLTLCKPSYRFCSVSWDKKVNFCSYSPSKEVLEELSFAGLKSTLQKIEFKRC